MRRRIVVRLCAVVVGSVVPVAPVAQPTAMGAQAASPDPPARRTAVARGAAPMAFEENVGQTDARVRYVAHGDAYTAFVTADGATLGLAKSGASLRMSWAGGSRGARVEAAGPLPGTANYMRGRDPERWKTDVPTFERVRYEGVYRGVDAVVYGAGRHLAYDFVVAPGADPSQIRVRFEGADEITTAEDGSLRLRVAGREVRQERASVYQEGAGGKRAVPVRYEVIGSEVGFALGEYDRTKTIVVDPTIVFAGYLGGTAANADVQALALDASGAIYVVGSTTATNFPATPGAYRPTISGRSDGYLVRLSPAGDAIVSATYFGGSGDDGITGIALGPSGSVYVAGFTDSSDFPATSGAYDTTPAGEDAFVARLNGAGTTLEAATLLGGASYEAPLAVSVDGSGAVLLAGTTESADFPTTPGAFDTSADADGDAFVARLGGGLDALLYATLVGGSMQESPTDAVFDATGAVYVTGYTDSDDFPTTPGAYDVVKNDRDAFVSKVSTAAGTLVYSTFVGGRFSELSSYIGVDAAGNAYLATSTTSDDYPVTPGAFDPEPSRYLFTGAVTKLNPSGSAVVYSTFLGAGDPEDVAVDASGAIYVVGTSGGVDDFPVTPGAFQTTPADVIEGFVTKLAPSGGALEYSTFLGGLRYDSAHRVAVDATGAAYVAGITGSADFPITGPALGPSFDGVDAFVAKLAPSGSTLGFSRTLGGSRSADPEQGTYDRASAAAVDAQGNVYVASVSTSNNFPTTPGAPDSQNTGGFSYEGVVTKTAPDGTILYSTYIGGSESDIPQAIAVDAAGAAYVGGNTVSDDFPVTAGAFQTDKSGATDGFVAKIAPAGNAIVFASFLGSSHDEDLTAIGVDAAGRPFVGGYTRSGHFPTTPGAFSREFAGEDQTFVTRFNATGSGLVFSTFIAPNSRVYGVATDASNAVYVVGTGGPDATPGAFDTEQTFADGFVTKLNPAGTALIYSTFLGGTRRDAPSAVAVTASGEAVVVGNTNSVRFPTTPGAYDTNPHGERDGFVTKLNLAGSALVYSTYLGGAGDDLATAVAVDAAGRAYVTGLTASADFPTTAEAFDATYGGGGDAFLTQLAADGSQLGYSTFLGAAGADAGYGVAAGKGGVVYAVGQTDRVDWLGGGFGQADGSNGYVVAISFAGDTVGVYVPTTGAWFLRGANASGPAETVFTYGAGGAGLVPLFGDWNGDGTDTPGLYDPATGAFFLKNSSASGTADLVFTFGPGGAGVTPVVGDFDGNGTDTVGIYVRSTSAFFLKNTNASGVADVVFRFGSPAAGLVPVFGDWNGDGRDTVGLYGPADGTFFLKNTNEPGAADLAFAFGPGSAGFVPLSGDWDGDGDDTVGLYTPVNGAFFLKTENAGGAADFVFSFGAPGAIPLAGTR